MLRHCRAWTSTAFAWLLTDEGQALLARAVEATGETGYDELAVQAELRRTTAAERVAAALTQAELRRRAVPKFGDLAARMYFTHDGLEQATRLSVGTHRAGRLQAAVTQSAIDLGCGIGGDLLALARAGIVVAGVDLDPVRVAVAQANLAALGLAGAVQVADATEIDVGPFDVAFADPARRGGRGRTFHVDEWTPPVAVRRGPAPRQRLRQGGAGHPARAGPARRGGRVGQRPRRGQGGGAVVGAAGDGRAARDGDRRRRAGDADRGGRPGRRGRRPRRLPLRAGRRGDPGGAGHRGRGRRTRRLLDHKIAYVTSDESFRTPFARSYRVVEEVPYREKPLRAALRARGIGTLTIKKRGVDVSPEQLRKRLSLHGEDEATLVLTRARGEGIALLVKPF